MSDMKTFAEAIKQVLRRFPVEDINLVVRGSEAYLDAKPLREAMSDMAGARSLEVTIRLTR